MYKLYVERLQKLLKEIMVIKITLFIEKKP